MNDLEIKDIDKFKNLLIEFGVEFDTDLNNFDWDNKEDIVSVVNMTVGGYTHKKCAGVVGYSGFFSAFCFDEDGKFIKIVIGE